jgi:hypothetical protein
MGYSTTFTWPGNTIDIEPPNAQMSLQSLVSAGMLDMSTLGLPGIQGPAGIGVHGIGVSTPSAAAVAAATIGFEGMLHIPKGGTFTKGAMSMMVAPGVGHSGRPAGITTRLEGASPPLH